MNIRNVIWTLVAVVLLAGAAARAGEIRRVQEEQKPEIWMKSDIKLVMAAERIARADAIRKMLEKLYGVRIDAQHTVYDLARDNENVNATLQGTLKGMRELRWVYSPEGICQVEMAVTWRMVVEEIQKTVRSYCDQCGTYTEEINNVNIKSYDTEVKVWGNGAIAGTNGVREIQALRAAEVDAYKRLAARIMGIQVNATTTVRDMALASDVVRTCIAATIKGGDFTDYRFEPRKVEVTCVVTLRNLILNLQATYRKDQVGNRVSIQEIQNLEAKEEFKQIEEKGVGIIDQTPPASAAPKTVAQQYSEINVVVEKAAGIAVQ